MPPSAPLRSRAFAVAALLAVSSAAHAVAKPAAPTSRSAGWHVASADGWHRGMLTAAEPAAQPREISKGGDRAATTGPGPATTTGAKPGQAGYVHYFLLRKPDGTSEMQIGIELADQTIAWAFADGAVEIAPFIESGTREANGRTYRVDHLFGIRPFPDEAAMAKLARDLQARIMPWIEDGVQHCDLDPPPRALCVSCLGFVLRVLFPAGFPLPPALPADLVQARRGERYTTEDLLLYLTGLHNVATREAKLERIGGYAMPASMREELLRLVTVEPAAEEVRSPVVRPRRSAKADGKARPGRAAAPRRL